MNRHQLVQEIQKKKSLLCVGLDTDMTKIPKHLLSAEDPVFEFNKAIIDATQEYCVSYKPNLAFYEAQGLKGWISLKKTIDYIPKNIFTIADAKRGDIGNTSTQYARAFFEELQCDSVTIAPYMGKDSVEPFLQFKDKWAIVLGLTSNEGAFDFQYRKDVANKPLFLEVIEKVASWGTPENLMFVVGATKAEQLKEIRNVIPEHFLLVPGVGAQGGSLEEVCTLGMNKDYGLLINSSRQILYASSGEDFADKAAEQAHQLQQTISVFI